MIAPFILIGWIPAALLFFACLPPRRALLASFVVGWLFLPDVKMNLPGLPQYGKLEATCLGAFFGVMVFDSTRLTSFRPHWIDVPGLVWCVTPLATSLSNGLGLYDGLSGVLGNVVQCSLAVLLGRIYLDDRAAMLDAAKAVILGALAYAPLCWVEIALSPQLHKWIYGFHQHSFKQAIRYGGYRPMVFLPDGIAVAVFMAIAASLVFLLWRSKALTSICGMPSIAIFVILAATSIACKTLSGLSIAGLVGLAAVLPAGRWRRFFLLVLIAAAPIYMTCRVTGVLRARTLENFVAKFDAERAGSLSARLEQEDLFSAHTARRPVFGWGGWMRNFPKDDKGKQLTRGVDAYWVIALSKNGYIGLACSTVAMLIAPFMLYLQTPSRLFGTPNFAPYEATALTVCAVMVNSLFNGQSNPLIFLGLGGLASAVTTPLAEQPSTSVMEARRPAIPVLRPAALRRLVPGGPQ